MNRFFYIVYSKGCISKLSYLFLLNRKVICLRTKKKQMYVFILAYVRVVCYNYTILREVVIIMYKSFKFRLYPDKAQLELLNKSFGCSRFIYNYYLSNIKNSGYIDAYSNISNYVNNLKYEYTFLQEIDRDINASINIMYDV
mgnify:CR=1 FL=1